MPLAAVVLGETVASFAAELWTGCDFGCSYCLPVARRWARRCGSGEESDAIGETRVRRRGGDSLNLERLNVMWEDGFSTWLPPAFLSQMSDPYPRLEESLRLTRRAIHALHGFGVGARVLTKSGTRAVVDFQSGPGTPLSLAGEGDHVDDLEHVDVNAEANLGSHPDDAYGATLTFMDDTDSRRWEPRAGLPSERIAGLQEAHRRGIRTWVSMMPVIGPAVPGEIIRGTHEFVDLFVLGPRFDPPWTERASSSRACPSLGPEDWREFAAGVVELCESLGAACFVVRSPEGEAADDQSELLREMDEYVDEQFWAECCRARKPSWVPLNSMDIEEQLSEICVAATRDGWQ
jgi:hypothetical protein